MNDNLKEMKSLITELNQYSYEYYTLGKPTISDKSYDLLYDKLVSLEKETNIRLSNSPTQNVGYETLKGLNKVKHEYKLLSLDKCHSEQEVINWSNNKSVIAMLKLDGLTTDLTYENGKLIRAETRGNGEIGEDILHNVIHYSNVPLTIKDKRHIHIVGESIIDYKEFNRVNSNLSQDKQFKNPRNLVSGTVRNYDSNICKQRKVLFVGYNLFGVDELNSKIEHLNYIQELGFTVCPHSTVLNNLTTDVIKETIKSLQNISNLISYPIDGIVFTYNDIKYGLSLGNTAHHPKHSIAYKFHDDLEETTLIKVEYQVGRTGKITPVAIFNPVELEGTTVSQANLHNLNILNDLQLHNGDRITVYKANQIIPQVADNLDKNKTHNSKPYLKINNCPICRNPTRLIKSDNSMIEYCINENCKARLIQKLSHYCSKEAINIDGLSEKTLEKFINLGLLNSIIDIYKLKEHKDVIIKQDGFGIKSYNNLINSIEKSKTCKLENFIYALGIQNVGKSISKDIIKFFNNNCNSPNDVLKNILNCTTLQLMKINDCGEETTKSIYNFFHNEYNRQLIYNLLDKGIIFITDNQVNQNEIQDNILKGKTIYCTGKFSIKKEELKDKINKLGGIYANGYKKSLDYLITGGDTSKSGKVEKAKKDNVPIMTEEELLKLFTNC